MLKDGNHIEASEEVSQALYMLTSMRYTYTASAKRNKVYLKWDLGREGVRAY